MKNIELAQRVIQELVNVGVKEFVYCAGARNSPFVAILDENKNITSYNFFEERSASFFALGRIATTRRPVALITTSGTAVAEVLPAAIEANYSSLPLIIVSADRPKAYRGTGAPQSIEQVGIFTYYIEVMLDLDEVNNHVSLQRLSWKKPIHLNVCFREPLLDAPIPQITIPEKADRQKLPVKIPMNTLSDIKIFLQNQRPLILLGYLPDKAQSVVLEFLEKYRAPVYAEGISGLRGHPKLHENLIWSGDRMVHKLLKKEYCDSVLRIGGVPTIRAWRDLESTLSSIPVLSISYNHYTGLGRETRHFSHMEILNQIDIEANISVSPVILSEDKENFLNIKKLLSKYPQSEPSLVHNLSKHTKDQSVYLGNSLPIREWDLFSDFDTIPKRIVGNRGANGIDGQISTFLGWSESENENWCIIGDLTALYDMTGLWPVNQMPKTKYRVVVINNGGGQIFYRMFRRDVFLNKHTLEFSHWAKMWGWDYQLWKDIPSHPDLSDHQVIEIKPDDEQTRLFWDEHEKLWNQ